MKTPSEGVKAIERQYDKAFARFVINTQTKLSKSSPVDTARLAASWVIGKGNPSNYVPPEREARGPEQPPQYGGEITMDGDWYVSSNLPYTVRVAYDPIWGKNGRRGGSAWFTNITDNMGKDYDRILSSELRMIS